MSKVLIRAVGVAIAAAGLSYGVLSNADGLGVVFASFAYVLWGSCLVIDPGFFSSRVGEGLATRNSHPLTVPLTWAAVALLSVSFFV